MTPLVRIRAERDSMSAIDRRIADFLLENAHLLRDYSSPQLADALGISQSSVVKFSQRLGFRGYPDLKYSIGDALARGDAAESQQPARVPAEPHAELSADLWQRKAKAEQETRLLNGAAELERIVALLRAAPQVHVAGMGEDAMHAHACALRLSLLGLPVVEARDLTQLAAGMGAIPKGAVLLALSAQGQQHALCILARQFHDAGGRVVSMTRHSANPLRAGAEAALLVSAHDEDACLQPLLYHAAAQHLLDLVLVLLCEADPQARQRLAAGVERMQHLLHP